MDIGQRLKDLRIRKNLTQEELGERVDLTKGYISQLEHNQGSPSMETFFDLLNVLGETPAAFFNEGPADQIVYPEAEQTDFTDDERGYTLRWLVPESNENEMEPVALTLQPGGTFKTFEPSPAETFIDVQDGAVTLVLGKTRHVAKEGETIYFHATQQHQLVNAGQVPCQLILVATASYL